MKRNYVTALLIALLSVGFLSCNEDSEDEPTVVCASDTREAADLLTAGDWEWSYSLTEGRGGEVRETPQSTGTIRGLRFETDLSGQRLENGQVVSGFTYSIRATDAGLQLVLSEINNTSTSYTLEVCQQELTLTNITNSLGTEEYYTR